MVRKRLPSRSNRLQTRSRLYNALSLVTPHFQEHIESRFHKDRSSERHIPNRVSIFFGLRLEKATRSHHSL